MKALLRSRFLRFAIVGAAGFVVNAAAFHIALNVFHAGYYTAWFIAFLPAVTFTWWGNRNLTFHEHASRTMVAAFHEWLRFVMTNGIGALLNFVTYSVLLSRLPFPPNNPYVPFVALAAGVLVGMVFNFALSKKLVFKA